MRSMRDASASAAIASNTPITKSAPSSRSERFCEPPDELRHLLPGFFPIDRCKERDARVLQALGILAFQYLGHVCRGRLREDRYEVSLAIEAARRRLPRVITGCGHRGRQTPLSGKLSPVLLHRFGIVDVIGGKGSAAEMMDEDIVTDVDAVARSANANAEIVVFKIAKAETLVEAADLFQHRSVDAQTEADRAFRKVSGRSEVVAALGSERLHRRFGGVRSGQTAADDRRRYCCAARSRRCPAAGRMDRANRRAIHRSPRRRC